MFTIPVRNFNIQTQKQNINFGTRLNEYKLYDKKTINKQYGPEKDVFIHKKRPSVNQFQAVISDEVKSRIAQFTYNKCNNNNLPEYIKHIVLYTGAYIANAVSYEKFMGEFTKDSKTKLLLEYYSLLPADSESDDLSKIPSGFERQISPYYTTIYLTGKDKEPLTELDGSYPEEIKLIKRMAKIYAHSRDVDFDKYEADKDLLTAFGEYMQSKPLSQSKACEPV